MPITSLITIIIKVFIDFPLFYLFVYFKEQVSVHWIYLFKSFYMIVFVIIHVYVCNTWTKMCFNCVLCINQSRFLSLVCHGSSRSSVQRTSCLSLVYCLFVCLFEIFFPLENFSFIWRHHHYKWMTATFTHTSHSWPLLWHKMSV